jgi:excisionase family DNA binding protein
MSKIIVTSEDDFKAIVKNILFEFLPQFTETMNHEKEKFLLEEAADYLKMPVPSFRLHQHKIGGIKIGKRWMFTRSDLDRFMEKNRHKTLDEIREDLI